MFVMSGTEVNNRCYVSLTPCLSAFPPTRLYLVNQITQLLPQPEGNGIGGKFLTIRPTAPERGTQSRIVMGQIKHILRQARGLDDAPHLDGALVLDQRPYRVQ